MSTKETNNGPTVGTDQLEREPDRLDDGWINEPGGGVGFEGAIEAAGDKATTLETFAGSVRPRPRRLTADRDTAYIVDWSADMPDSHRTGGFDPDRTLRHRPV